MTTYLQVPKRCLIYDDVVYVCNLKCASTFFYENFTRHGWQTIPYSSIDFCKHKIFGHLLDPLLKRAKGQAEYVFMHDLCKEFVKNPHLQLLVTNSFLLDFHSVTYHMAYGDRVNYINWIPIDNDHARTIQLTESFLAYHKIPIPIWDFLYRHPGSTLQKQCEKILYNLYTCQEFKLQLVKDSLWKTIYEDIKDNCWPACDHQKDFGLLPLEVRKEICQDVNLQKILKFSKNFDSFEFVNEIDASPKIWDTMLQPDMELYKKVTAYYANCDHPGQPYIDLNTFK